MEFKKEDYERRRDELGIQLNNAQAVMKRLEGEADKTTKDILAIDGAIQECNYWIAKFEKKELKNKA